MDEETKRGRGRPRKAPEERGSAVEVWMRAEDRERLEKARRKGESTSEVVRRALAVLVGEKP